MAFTADAPVGLHFSEEEIVASIETMRRHLKEGAGPGDAVYVRVAEVLVLAYIRVLPDEMNRGTTPQQFGEAVVRAMGWMAAQLAIGAPSHDERVRSVSGIGLNVMFAASHHLSQSDREGVTMGLVGEPGAHA